MDSYIHSNARGLDGHSVQYEAHLSLWPFLPRFIIACSCMGGAVWVLLTPPEIIAHVAWPASICLGIIGVLMIVMVILVCQSTELAITDRLVIVKVGAIQRRTIELLVHKVESVQVNQGLLGRMLDYGTLVISAAGDDNAEIEGIDDPMGFRRAYQQVELIERSQSNPDKQTTAPEDAEERTAFG